MTRNPDVAMTTVTVEGFFPLLEIIFNMRLIATSDKALLETKEFLNPNTVILRSSKRRFNSQDRKTSYTQAFNSITESLSSALCQVP